MKTLIQLWGALVLTGASALAGSQYISSDALMNYASGKSVIMAGGQTVQTEDGTGYVTSGRLSSNQDHFVYYGPARQVILLRNSLVTFSGGYASDGYLYTGGAQSLYFGSSSWEFFLPNSHIFFSAGYVAKGYLNGTNVYLPYGNGNVLVNTPAAVDFEPGASGTGVVKMCVLKSAQYVNYGPNRFAYIRANGTFTSFSGGYLSQGVLENGTFLQTSSSSVFVAASTICNFSGGYYVP